MPRLRDLGLITEYHHYKYRAFVPRDNEHVMPTLLEAHPVTDDLPDGLKPAA